MSTMLPAAPDGRFSLTDVFPSCRAALQGAENALGLPRARSAAVLLVDGLGQGQLSTRAGHARTLARGAAGASGPRVRRGTVATVFPSTTAAALASLTTGVLPGEHGLVGYSVLDPDDDRVVNQLSGWDEGLVPESWQRRKTVFEEPGEGVVPVVIGPARYAESGFTRAVLRGAEYLTAEDAAERLETALERMNAGPTLAYVYFPELDQAGHSEGWQSDRWTGALEDLDAAVARFAARLHPKDGALLTADHGMIDVPAHSHVVVDVDSMLLAGVRHVAGEPRGLQLHFEPGLPESARAAVAEAWRAAEGERAWVLTRDELVTSGLMGPVHPEVLPRLGDLFVVARKQVAYYTSESPASSRRMVGQHGALSAEEVTVPLLRFGAFAR